MPRTLALDIADAPDLRVRIRALPASDYSRYVDGLGSGTSQSAWNEETGDTKDAIVSFPDVRSHPRLHAPKEVDHGSADLRRAFLLGPMAAARQHDGRPELGNQCRLLRNGRSKGGGDEIALAHHVERGNGYLCAGKGSQQLPAAID